MKHCYLVLPLGWSVPFQNERNGANVFTTVADSQGRELVSLNAVNEFPEIFKDVVIDTFPTVWLDSSDFSHNDSNPL